MGHNVFQSYQNTDLQKKCQDLESEGGSECDLSVMMDPMEGSLDILLATEIRMRPWSPHLEKTGFSWAVPPPPPNAQEGA